ncbi:uncharacterized protein BDZ99DRAFT_7421 [Mytilinidion resinicola]|uniref:Uncharacterized protein n=1 Tax=Mytilinidion resinicola TaxID=574789 RepID=A0A6A6Z9R9_9PEZI|nr:uncharacterized protein BDZ99DRAFT_7421 [Mytilinidion resinicola]KAF2817024.1 hypothetical protein BDZ99DRAFT_7421 [Mytilinidion resinicola]
MGEWSRLRCRRGFSGCYIMALLRKLNSCIGRGLARCTLPEESAIVRLTRGLENSRGDSRASSAATCSETHKIPKTRRAQLVGVVGMGLQSLPLLDPYTYVHDMGDSHCKQPCRAQRCTSRAGRETVS